MPFLFLCLCPRATVSGGKTRVKFIAWLSIRYTMQIRVTSSGVLPAIDRLEAFTDSTLQERRVKLSWKKAPAKQVQLEGYDCGQIGWDNPKKPGHAIG